MPTYEYRCTKCGHRYEKFQNMSDNSRPRCPKCRSKGEREISGGVGIVFKGSGFYITDYKRAGERKPESESEGDGKKASSGETKSEADKSKPDKPSKASGAET